MTSAKNQQRPLDPESFVTSPYAPDRMPVPTLEELAQMGLRPKSDEKSIQVTTRSRSEVVFAMDRIIEKKVYALKSRHDFFRLALMNLVVQLEDEIQQGHVRLSIRRLEDQRRLVGELQQMRHVVEMVIATQKAVGLFLQYDNRMEAIQALRNAKRYAEEIPYDGLRKRFVNLLYGSENGQTRPEQAKWDDTAQLWHGVWEGDLDRDDSEEIEEKVKVF